jgi:hypothetical protein
MPIYTVNKRRNMRGMSVSSVAVAAFDPSSIAGYSRDWNFADITKLFQDVLHTTPVTADGDPIGSIVDGVGGTVYLAAPADDTTRPTYETGIQNGLSVGRFDGSNDYLSGAGSILADASQTIIIVLKERSAPSSTARGVLAFDANNIIYTDTDSGTGFNYYRNEAAGVVDLGGTPANWNILVLKYASAAAVTRYINGGAGSTFDPNDGYATATALNLGSDNAGGAPGDFDIGRVLIYSAALSNTDLDYIISGLGTLWDIAVTPVS